MSEHRNAQWEVQYQSNTITGNTRDLFLCVTSDTVDVLARQWEMVGTVWVQARTTLIIFDEPTIFDIRILRFRTGLNSPKMCPVQRGFRMPVSLNTVENTLERKLKSEHKSPRNPRTSDENCPTFSDAPFPQYSHISTKFTGVHSKLRPRYILTQNDTATRDSPHGFFHQIAGCLTAHVMTS